MDQSVLVQYSEVMEEIKDLRERIRKLDRFLSDPPVVSDTVRGSRKDGTIGPIKITGIPVPEYSRKEKIRERYHNLKYYIYPMLGTMSTQSGPDSIGIFYTKNK